MVDLSDIARATRQRRKELGLTQQALAERSRVSRLLIAHLETNRLPELGYKKLLRILHAVGLDVRITNLNQQRPTLEDLVAEEGVER